MKTETKPAFKNNIASITEAQADMRKSYGNGALGVLTSGLIWLCAAMVSYYFSERQAVWALLIGGMFIHPISILFYKILKIKGKHHLGNPLGKLAMESTIFMVMCLPLAFGLSLERNEWFFQGMLMIIGGRYLIFETIYGIKLYWILGALLVILAYFLFKNQIHSFYSSLSGSVIEIAFGIFMYIHFRKNLVKG